MMSGFQVSVQMHRHRVLVLRHEQSLFFFRPRQDHRVFAAEWWRPRITNTNNVQGVSPTLVVPLQGSNDASRNVFVQEECEHDDYGLVVRRMASMRLRSSDAEGPFAVRERWRSISSSQRAMYSSTASRLSR